jgi:2,5-diketo-D-gluconate reductase B
MHTMNAFGESIAKVGLGTWDIRGQSGLIALRRAIELGYRHFDTAEMYRNEEIVGEAINGSGISRGDFFVTTKAWSNKLTYDEIKQACEESLKRLNLDYLDLYLIHRPGIVPLEETLRGMQELVSEGRTRFIGVSNFSVDQLEESISISDEPIFTNQVEYHPYKRRDLLLSLCVEKGVILTAYSPVAGGRLVEDQRLREIGARYGKTATQVALRWLVQQEGVITIPKASSEQHQRENLDIFDFELPDEEMQAIDALGK